MLASTLDPSASEINKALSVTYKLLFILSKNIVPSRSYRYIRDRAFPVTRLPPPIYTKFDVKQRYIYTFGRWQAPWSPLQWNLMKALSLAYTLLFILSKNVVPSRSYRCLKMDVYSEIAHFCDKLASPLTSKVVRFGVSNETYIHR